MDQKYDSIGKTYTSTRRADPRITKALTDALALPVPAVIADIGAGTGNYSVELAKQGYRVFAVEPSTVMRGQGHRHTDLKWIPGAAENLPWEYFE